VKATNAYAAKRALFSFLATVPPFTETDPAKVVQLQYARDERTIGQRCVYGGGARFTQTEEAAEGVLRFETTATPLYVRVLNPGLSIQDAEAVVEGIADVLAQTLVDHPELTGELTFEQIVGGSAEFYQHDDAVEAILALSCLIESHLI
jgi:hypothetical protein